MRLDRLGVLVASFSSRAGPCCCVGAGGVLQASRDSTIGIACVGGISCVFFRCTLLRLYTVSSASSKIVRSFVVFQRFFSSSRTCPQVGMASSSRLLLHAIHGGIVKICCSSAFVAFALVAIGQFLVWS